MSQPISRPRAPLMAGKRAQNNENLASGQQAVTYVKDAMSSMQASTKGKVIATASSSTALKKRALVEKTNSRPNFASNGENKENINTNVIRNQPVKVRVPSVQAPIRWAPIQVSVPVKGPVQAPVQVPVKVPVQAPVQVPVQVPVKIPVQAPVQHQSRRVLQEKAIGHQERVYVVKKEAVVVKMEPGLVPERIPLAQQPVKSAVKRVLPPSTTESLLPLLEGEKEARAYEDEENRKRAKREVYLQWDDLDADDVHDPLMVSEYAVQIFDYMQELEVLTMPDPRYMDSQKELAWKMRGVLIDWLAEVHYKFKLLPETLFLSVNLIDRFLSLRSVSLVKLQLVGVTALFIAAKYEEVMAPSVANFIYMSDGGFKDKEILQAERYMLQTLGFQLSYPSPMNFLRRISKADNYDIHSRTVAKYLMEIPLLDCNFLECPPSMISGAALCLARRMMGHYDWHDNLVHYSGYTEEELMPCMERMVHYLQRPLKSQTFIFRKYSTKRFLKASIFVREWVYNMTREMEMQQLQAEAGGF